MFVDIVYLLSDIAIDFVFIIGNHIRYGDWFYSIMIFVEEARTSECKYVPLTVLFTFITMQFSEFFIFTCHKVQSFVYLCGAKNCSYFHNKYTGLFQNQKIQNTQPQTCEIKKGTIIHIHFLQFFINFSISWA